MKKFFNLNDPNSDHAKLVVKNNELIDKMLKSGIDIKTIPENLKNNSVNILVLLQGKDPGSIKPCNYNCDICYTKSRFNELGLSSKQIYNLVNNVRKLGAKALYVPGIGEPMMSKALLKYIELQKDDFPVIIFTNGSYLYDKNIQDSVGLNSNEFLKLIKSKPIYQYVKFWTTDHKKAKYMYGVKTPFVKRDNIFIPKSLDILLNNVEKQKIGVEVAVRSDNIEEIKDKIMPFCEKNKITCFIEPVIPSNKVAVKKYLSDVLSLANYFAITKMGFCKYRFARELVVNVSSIAPCIVFPKLAKYSVLNNDGSVKDSEEIFAMFHDNQYRDLRFSYSFGPKLCDCNKVIKGEIQWN